MARGDHDTQKNCSGIFWYVLELISFRPAGELFWHNVEMNWAVSDLFCDVLICFELLLGCFALRLSCSGMFWYAFELFWNFVGMHLSCFELF